MNQCNFTVKDESLLKKLENDYIDVLEYIKEILDELYEDYQEITEEWSQDEYWKKVDELIIKDIEEVLTRYYKEYMFCCDDSYCRYTALKVFIEEIIF